MTPATSSRLGIRVRRDQAEIALAALLPILQDGAEETEPARTRSSTRSTRRVPSCPRSTTSGRWRAMR